MDEPCQFQKIARFMMMNFRLELQIQTKSIRSRAAFPALIRVHSSTHTQKKKMNVFKKIEKKPRKDNIAKASSPSLVQLGYLSNPKNLTPHSS